MHNHYPYHFSAFLFPLSTFHFPLFCLQSVHGHYQFIVIPFPSPSFHLPSLSLPFDQSQQPDANLHTSLLFIHHLPFHPSSPQRQRWALTPPPSPLPILNPLTPWLHPRLPLHHPPTYDLLSHSVELIPIVNPYTMACIKPFCPVQCSSYP